MIYKKLLISCVVSSLLFGANGEDKEYQVDFVSNSGNYKKPTFSPAIEANKDFSWDRDGGIFIFGSQANTNPESSAIATFSSDSNNYGFLTLKNFSYLNTASDFRTGGLKAPTKEDSIAQKLTTSKLTILNNKDSGFKGFVLGASGGSGGNVNLYTGTNLEIKDFTQTVLSGTVNINAGSLSKDTSYYGYLKSSLSIQSEKDYSILSMRSSLYLNTNNSESSSSASYRTKERSEAKFEANIKGDIYWNGYTSLADKAVLDLRAGNVVKMSSTIYVAPQEMKKITQDSLGNQSVAEADRVKKDNLMIFAPKIELSGTIDLGVNAQEIKTEERNLPDSSLKKTVITQLPSDIGAIAKITADINSKQNNTASSSTEKPKDWTEATKAQFVQTSGGRINIGMNSEARIQVINNKATNSTKIFDEKDPYALTFSNVTIQDQKIGNKVLNLDAQVLLREKQSNAENIGEKKEAETLKAIEGAGKVLFQGRFDLGKNANAKITAYDGFDLGKDSSFVLAKDSLLWLSTDKTQNTIENQGSIEAKGGAFVAGGVYENNGQHDTTLKNTGSVLISDSHRSTTVEDPIHPNPPIPRNTPETSEELDPAGFFLLGQKNIFDNQGSLIFDGFGNLTTMTAKDDEIQRDLEINNSSNKKGIIEARGAKNTITSGGSIKISSQDISITSKTIEEGEGDEKKTVTHDGELILRSESKNPESKIILGNETMQSGRDRVSVTGGTFKIESKAAGVDSYNLRLVDTTLDLSRLSVWERDGAMHGGGGVFVNKRRLELGGNVKILVVNEQGAFVNGEYQGKVSEFKTGLPTMIVRGDNSIYFSGDASKSQGTFSFDNHANLELHSNARLRIGGDYNNNGSTIFKADQFGVGSIWVEGNLIFDMTNHQGGDKSVNPLIAINHTNFYSLSLDQVYLLMQTDKQIQYRVGALVIDSSDGQDPNPRPKDNTREEENTLVYAKQQEYLKKEIEDFLNGAGAYDGNENKLGIFLKGIAYIDTTRVGFALTRSDAIANIQSNSSPTGVIDQYFDILSKSDAQISANKTNAMKQNLSASHSRAFEVLNNALESKNSLELGILKDIGSYNAPGLIDMAQAINNSMEAMANIEKPLMEDFQKMQVVREVAVQNRLMRFSNPYIAEIELAQYIQNLSLNRYVQAEVQSDVATALPSYNPQGGEKLSYKHSFWASAISSTTKETGNTSALYGFSAGYEYMPLANVLIGAYVAYGYSDFKSSLLKNNAHNLDLTLYTRLYYGSSEVDLTLGYIQAFNTMKIDNPNPSLSQALDFDSGAFDFSIKYGYIFKIPKVKGLFVKPQGSYTIYGMNIPDLEGVSSASIVYDKQFKGGMIFNLGAEIRQYISAYSFLYVLPSFEYNLMNKEGGSVYFAGATNKLQYSSKSQARGIFSLYAGGEGYISPDFSLNLSAGYKAGLEKEEHNISISAGLRYKF